MPRILWFLLLSLRKQGFMTHIHVSATWSWPLLAVKLVACSYLAHCLIQYWLIIKWTRQWNFLEQNVVCKMLTILFRNLICGMCDIDSMAFTSWWHHNLKRICRITGPLWGHSSGHQGIYRAKTNNADLWCIQRVDEQTIDLRVIFETPWHWCDVTDITIVHDFSIITQVITVDHGLSLHHWVHLGSNITFGIVIQSWMRFILENILLSDLVYVPYRHS